MATYAELLVLAKTNLETALTNPSPNYSIGDKSVSYADYIAITIDTIKKLEELVSSSSEDGPVEEISYME